MHTIDVLLYIVAVAAFVIGAIESIRAKPLTTVQTMFWLYLGLLAWVLVTALPLWGVK
jgi:hypothetical protein